MSSRHAAIEIQISARIAKPKNRRPLTEKIIRQAIIRRAETGEETPGIELQILRWRHGKDANWTDAKNTAEEWIRFGRFLPSAPIIIQQNEKIRSR